MRCLAGAMFVILAMASAPAAAAPLQFRISGVELTVPVPEGYCLPGGAHADAAQLVAAADDQNVTHAMLVRCGAAEAANDYILLKTPKQALLATVGRKELLDAVGAEFDSPLFAEELASGKLMGEVGSSLGTVLGTQVDLSGSFGPRGKDDVCAYLGGTMDVNSPVASYALSAGSCITAVEGRIIVVHWYGPDRGAAGVAELLRKSRGLAMAMTGRRAP